MKEYIPKMLRKFPDKNPIKRKEVWCVGVLERKGEIGGIHGPFPKEIDALETIGEKGQFIIHSYPKQGKDIAEWKWKNDRWIKLKIKLND